MSLLALQRDFRGWLDTEAPDAAARIGAAAAPGLSVYLNNYRGQLMDCLRESFGMVHAWIGDEAFDGAAATHIERHPPHCWTLDAYALDFPQTLDALYPDDPEVGELACLERELGLTFVGPDAAPLDRATLPGIDWEAATLHLVPTLRILTVKTNAAAIWSSLATSEPPPAAMLLPEPAAIAVWRDGFAPTFRTLDDVERDALLAVRDGTTFGALCASLVAMASEEEGPALAGTLLGRWLDDGLVERIVNA
jgi:hypothetical protein